MKMSRILLPALLAQVAGAVALNPLDMRWTFGAHEPYTMYRRVGRHCTGGVDGNARWVKPWLDWFDAESPALMENLGLNWLHSRFYKGMGWAIEQKDFPNVKKFVANCHAHGVHALAYVQFSTLYPEVMRAEIPNVDDWAQRNERGEPNPYFLGSYFRHMPCINCAEWEAYIKRMCTIALTEGGFDGIMFDNAFSLRCFCARCEKSFQAYLQAQPDKEARFGFSDVSGFRIPRCESSAFSGEVRDPVVQAWIRWRTDTTTAIFRRLRNHIKSVKPDAVVSANVQPFRRQGIAPGYGVDMVEIAEVLDLIIGQCENYPRVTSDGGIVNRVRELKLARAMSTPIVALCDADAKMRPDQERFYLLPLCEDLAFGGVPTDRTVICPKARPGFIDPDLVARRKPKLAAFNAFVTAHRAALSAPVYEPVRLFYPEKEVAFSRLAAESLCAAEEILSRRQIPWGYLVSRPGHVLEVPPGTEVIVVVNQVALSSEQTSALVHWAASGGRLVVTGDSGRYDTFNAQYLANPFLPQLKDAPHVALRAEADSVKPATLGWSNRIGIPADHGAALVADLARTGWKAPFALEGCPERVGLDMRRSATGWVFQFVNYNPSEPVKGLKLSVPGAKRMRFVAPFDGAREETLSASSELPAFAQYALVEVE